MKIYILGNNKENNNSLSSKLSELLDIKKYSIDDKNNITEINKIIKENREWIIEGNYNDNSNIIASNSTTIIYLEIHKKSFFKDKKNKIDNMNDFIMKYSSKILIIKSEKEIKKLIQAIYKGIEL